MKLAVAIFIGSIFAQNPEGPPSNWDEAERRIVRLAPTAFPELPGNLVRELGRRGCRIPQSPMIKGPHNVIQGEFARPGEVDWAVLCSVKGVSTILVFWNGLEKNPAAIAPMEDRDFLQGITDKEIGYSRGIGPATAKSTFRFYQALGGPKPPPMDHLGIDDRFLGKASVIWYFYKGKWLQLTGMD